jgi:hypothetical protein
MAHREVTRDGTTYSLPANVRPKYRTYTPRELPEPPDADIVRDFDDPRVAAEVQAEMMKRWEAMQKGSAERKRGIVEHVDPETGQVTRFDRYGDLVKKGFNPNRREGHVMNFFRYMNQTEDKRRATLEARGRDDAATQLDYENRARKHQYDEAGREGSINNYNELLRYDEKQRMAEEAADATAGYRSDRLDLDERKLTTPPPMHPAYEEYLGAQGRRWDAEADYTRGGKAAGVDSGGPPPGRLSHNQFLDRQQELEASIDEYRRGLDMISKENLGTRWMFGLLGSPDDKPSKVQSPVFGDEDVTINSGNREQYQNRYQRLLTRDERELFDLEQEYNAYYGSSGGRPDPGRPGPGRTGPPPPGGDPGVDPLTEGEPPGSGSNSLEALKAQSWLEKADELQMPGAGEMQQLSPWDQAWFTELIRLEEEGFNVDAPSVQDHAGQIVNAQMQGGQDARNQQPSPTQSRWPTGSR